jgi:hypothetical protein
MARFRLSSLLAFLCVLENAVALPQGYSGEPNFNLKPLLTDPIRKWSLNTTVSFPSSSAFNASTERWTIADPPTYVAAIRPGTEEDIGKVVSPASFVKIHQHMVTHCKSRSTSPRLRDFHF